MRWERSVKATELPWNQFDLERGVWTKPSHNMKQKRVEHVPLNNQAVAFLQSLPKDGEFLFPGRMGEYPTDLKFPWPRFAKTLNWKVSATLMVGRIAVAVSRTAFSSGAHRLRRN